MSAGVTNAATVRAKTSMEPAAIAGQGERERDPEEGLDGARAESAGRFLERGVDRLDDADQGEDRHRQREVHEADQSPRCR